MAQGKAYDKEKILKVLEPLFKLGYSRNKACVAAGFDNSLLFKWEQKDPELSIKIDSWIEYPNSKARRNWIGKIDEGDYAASKEWLERRDKTEFSVRTENINENTNIEIKKTIEDKRNDSDQS